MRHLSCFFLIVFALSVMPITAHAQTVLSSTLGNARSGNTNIRDSFTTTLGRYTADGQATITQVVVQIDTDPANIETLLGQSTMTVGGTTFAYDSYTSSNQLATFTGSVAVADGATGTVTLRCTSCGSNSYAVEMTTQASTGWDFSNSIQWSILSLVGTVPNSAPVLAAIGNQSHREGGSVSVTPSAADSNSGDTLTWSASGLPTGLSINSSTGAITGTASTAGSYSTTVTVSDGTTTDSESFTWTITANNAPVMSAIGDRSGTIGTAVNITPSASDVDSDTISWSASGLPAGLSINSGTGAITGTPTTNNAYSTTVTINDGFGGSDSESFTFTIANTAPVLAMIGDQSSTTGTAVNVTPSATDTNGDSISWSATGLPTGLSIDAGTGAITGTPSAAGTYNTTINISDGNSGTDSETLTWTVVSGNAAPVLTPIEAQSHVVGATVSFTPSASDANSDTLTYAATGLPTGLSIDASSGAITGSPTAAGSYSVTFTVSDPDGEDDSEAFTWTITAAAPVEDDDSADDGGDDMPVTVEDLEDDNVAAMLDVSHQSLILPLRGIIRAGQSRFAELRQVPLANEGSPSSVQIDLSFADDALQQISNAGGEAAFNDFINRKLQDLLPAEVALWSRGQVQVGKLDDAANGESVKIRGGNFSFGLDSRINEYWTAGVMLQRADNDGETDSQDVEADMTGAMLYASIQPTLDYHIQIGLGTSGLTQKTKRMVNGDRYTGDRKGDAQTFLLTTGQLFQWRDLNIAWDVEAIVQNVTLKAYQEEGGTAAYGYLKQQLRQRHIGGSLGLHETRILKNGGMVTLIGALGGQLDFSKDSEVDSYLLADPSTIFRYTAETGDNGQSLSHGLLTLEAVYYAPSATVWRAGLEVQNYSSGQIFGLTVGVSRSF